MLNPSQAARCRLGIDTPPNPEDSSTFQATRITDSPQRKSSDSSTKIESTTLTKKLYTKKVKEKKNYSENSSNLELYEKYYPFEAYLPVSAMVSGRYIM